VLTDKLVECARPQARLFDLLAGRATTAVWRSAGSSAGAAGSPRPDEVGEHLPAGARAHRLAARVGESQELFHPDIVAEPVERGAISSGRSRARERCTGVAARRALARAGR